MAALFRLRNLLADSVAASAIHANPFVTSVAVLGIVAFPLFYLVWTYAFPQPYENLTLRLIGSGILVPLALRDRWPARWKPLLPLYWQFMCFYCLAFFFYYMLLRNELSNVWTLSTIAATFLLTFFVHWLSALLIFVAGSALAWGYYLFVTEPTLTIGQYLQYIVIFPFPLVFGGAINHKLQRYREAQAMYERRLLELSELNSKMMRDQNEILTRFLSNSIVSRLRRYQRHHGLDAAMMMVTQQKRKFCGIMQADIRNFTKLFGYEAAMGVAQLVKRCFHEITEVGQDIAVVKPVGDSIFVYSDDEFGEEGAVRNILALAILFVNSVSRINAEVQELGEKPLNFGIGVHAGEVVYGNLASETLVDPTIIGDNVNKTARLEELTKIPKLQQHIGHNAILMSKEIRALAQDFLPAAHIRQIELDEWNITIRDFEKDKKIHVLDHAASRALYDLATDHIEQQRRNPLIAYGRAHHQSHKGIGYFYEMEGSGPNTAWTIQLDLSQVPLERVERTVLAQAGDLEYEIAHSDGRWLVISTRNARGEYDEVAVEHKVHAIIDALSAPPGP